MCDRPLFEMTGVAARPLQQVTNDCCPSKAIGCSHDTGALIKCGHSALIECPRPSQSRLCVCARKLRRNPPAQSKYPKGTKAALSCFRRAPARAIGIQPGPDCSILLAAQALDPPNSNRPTQKRLSDIPNLTPVSSSANPLKVATKERREREISRSTALLRHMLLQYFKTHP